MQLRMIYTANFLLIWEVKSIKKRKDSSLKSFPPFPPATLGECTYHEPWPWLASDQWVHIWKAEMCTSENPFLVIYSYDRGEPAVSYRWTGWVEEKPVEVQDYCRKITEHFRGIHRIYRNLMKENRRMSTCNQLVGLANTRIWTCYAQKSPRSLVYSLQFKNSEDLISYSKISKLKLSCSSFGSANVLIYLDLWDVRVYRLHELFCLIYTMRQSLQSTAHLRFACTPASELCRFKFW